MSKWREMKVWQEMPWQQQRKDTFYQWKEILQSSNHKALSNQSQYYLEMLKKNYFKNNDFKTELNNITQIHVDIFYFVAH